MEGKEIRICDTNGKLVGIIDTQKNVLIIKRGNATTVITVDSKGELIVKERK